MVTDRQTDRPTNRPTDIATYRAAIAAKKLLFPDVLDLLLLHKHQLSSSSDFHEFGAFTITSSYVGAALPISGGLSSMHALALVVVIELLKSLLVERAVIWTVAVVNEIEVIMSLCSAIGWSVSQSKLYDFNIGCKCWNFGLYCNSNKLSQPDSSTHDLTLIHNHTFSTPT